LVSRHRVRHTVGAGDGPHLAPKSVARLALVCPPPDMPAQYREITGGCNSNSISTSNFSVSSFPSAFIGHHDRRHPRSTNRSIAGALPSDQPTLRPSAAGSRAGLATDPVMANEDLANGAQDSSQRHPVTLAAGWRGHLVGGRLDDVNLESQAQGHTRRETRPARRPSTKANPAPLTSSSRRS
jgi:hypothetical protein